MKFIAQDEMWEEKYFVPRCIASRFLKISTKFVIESGHKKKSQESTVQKDHQHFEFASCSMWFLEFSPLLSTIQPFNGRVSHWVIFVILLMTGEGKSLKQSSMFNWQKLPVENVVEKIVSLSV